MKKLLTTLSILTLMVGSSFTAYAGDSSPTRGGGDTGGGETSGGGSHLGLLIKMREEQLAEKEAQKSTTDEDETTEDNTTEDPILATSGDLGELLGSDLPESEIPTGDCAPSVSVDGETHTTAGIALPDCGGDPDGGGAEIPTDDCGTIVAGGLGDCGGGGGTREVPGEGGDGGRITSGGGGGGGPSAPTLPAAGLEQYQLTLATSFALFLIASVAVLNRKRFSKRGERIR